ncbi:MAG: hypothetical protein NDJ89_14330 [Oligoflexia bacterium]|nr:hypothetical protein [Oligoflexia bacterium]
MEDQIQLKEIEEKKTEEKGEELYRISVSKAAEEALSSVVDRVNSGFEGGKVNRTQVLNWVLVRYAESCGDAEIREIRAEHFDDIAFLESVLRKAKKSGKVPSDIKALLQKQLGLDEAAKPRAKRDLKKNVINDDMTNEGDQ